LVLTILGERRSGRNSLYFLMKATQDSAANVGNSKLSRKKNPDRLKRGWCQFFILSGFYNSI